jgi:hypothetical protein
MVPRYLPIIFYKQMKTKVVTYKVLYHVHMDPDADLDLTFHPDADPDSDPHPRS